MGQQVCGPSYHIILYFSWHASIFRRIHTGSHHSHTKTMFTLFEVLINESEWGFLPLNLFQIIFYYRLFIILGVVLLVSSTRLVRNLPRPLRQFIQRKSGSIRTRDSSPSTVIQAATLHHLMPSSSKEKA